MLQLSEDVIALFNDKESKKALATVDKNGEVHVVFKGSLSINEDGYLEFLELLETSQTNKNMTYSIWFNKKVAINIVGTNGRSFQIKGVADKYIISGPYFEEKYKYVQGRNPEADLAGIWQIKPLEEKEETFHKRLAYERETYKIVGHIDRDLK